MGILNIIHEYRDKMGELQAQLAVNPQKWKSYQADLDRILDSVFGYFADFEKENFKNENKIYKMKRLFINNCRSIIRLGKYNRHVIDKPYGYQGDFMIIEEIYKNSPNTVGIERCMDNYFLKSAASIATRNRKENFEHYLLNFFNERQDHDIRILDLASGPCTDIIEFYETIREQEQRVFIDCLEHDTNAIGYSQVKLKEKTFKNQICFLQKNAIKIALTKNLSFHMPRKYDLIFSTGLFDYLDEKISTLLIRNLKNLLNSHGLLIVSNYRDKWSNPSRHFMEWGGDWELVYRTQDEFIRIFREAGFNKHQLSLAYEPLKVMQYCFASSPKC